MFIIDTYKDYCLAIANKTSDDPLKRNEAKKALGILKQTDSALYQEYKEKLENKSKKERKYSRPSTLAERQYFLKEHLEIDVMAIREKLRSSLLKGRYGLGLFFSIPFWMSRNDVLDAFDQLDAAELITGTGKPAPRETVIRRCVHKAIETGHFSEEKLRNGLISKFCSYYNSNLITLRSPLLLEPIKRMLKEEATPEELMRIDRPDGVFDTGNLVDLINSKELKITPEDQSRWDKSQRKKAQKEAKKAKLLQKRKERRERMNQNNNNPTK